MYKTQFRCDNIISRYILYDLSRLNDDSEITDGGYRDHNKNWCNVKTSN